MSYEEEEEFSGTPDRYANQKTVESLDNVYASDKDLCRARIAQHEMGIREENDRLERLRQSYQRARERIDTA